MFDVAVLVVGDVMLDRHVHGHVRRISPEAPVPVVSLAGEVHTPGGAGNVAATLAALGTSVTLAGLVGTDAEGAQLRDALRAKGVAKLVLHEGAGLQTITKTRILSEGQQQLLRLDRDGDRAAFAAAAEGLLGASCPCSTSRPRSCWPTTRRGRSARRWRGRSSTAAGAGASPAWSTPRRSTSPPMPARPS